MIRNAGIILGLIFSFHIASSKSVTIKGTLQGASKSGKFYFYQYYLDGYYLKDSVTHQAGKFTFKPKEELSRGFYRIGESVEKSVPFIGGNESFEVQADLGNPEKSCVFSKSIENSAFKEYMTTFSLFSEKISQLYMKMQKLNSGDPQISKEEFQSGMDKIRVQYDSLNTAQNIYYKSLATKYPGTMMQKMASILYISDTTTRDNFLRLSEFKDEELLRSDFLMSKIGFFFQKFVSPREEDYQKGAEQVLNLAPRGNPSRIAAFMAVGDVFIQNQLPSAEALFGMFRTEYPENPYVRQYLRKRGDVVVAEGEIAPEIALEDTAGKELKLSSLRGKIVLIDFWASWCGPCRMENPNVVQAYNKFKEKGFEILSVSLDNNKFKWLQAIKSDRMTWKHVSDLKGWQSSAANLYSVKSIPSTFLLDKEGKIIAKNLRGRALEETL
ncbi:MAG: AhpC/TSA family protein, partial [Cytophagales bacterium]|nr:AhpC/TSA family protein [Cytophagales bacterium]